MDELATPPIPALWLITDRRLAARQLPDVVEECLGAGLRAVQLREKDLPVMDLLALAAPLRESTRRHGARLLVNDRLDTALAVEADGVQRTGASLPVAILRRLAPPPFLVGASVHSREEAVHAEAEGADFVVFGPVYDTPSKRAYGPPQGDRVHAALAATPVPLIAIGGITPATAGALRAGGVHGVAVIRAILEAPDPAAATRALLAAP